ncbi:MAG: hypothetical protein HYT75_02245 [Deltaproteobacteria bacterium]|nr:hypothetical protein [Deltaproteobacteria bacterium]
MSKIKELAVVLFVLGFICACGNNSSTNTSSDSGSDDSGGGSDTSTGFTVSGTLNSLNVSLNKSLTSGTITDVMAVSPETGNASCKKAEVESDGTFSIIIDGKKPWFLYFIDSAKQGMQMFMGRLRASSTLDTFTPASTTGSTDLETITVDAENEVAESSKTESEITSDLGLDSDTVETIKGVDDVARRYGNPDMDDDGAVDCNSETSTTASYFLDFHIRFDMQTSGVNADVADIIDSYYSDSIVPAYTSTGIYVAYPTSFSSVSTGSTTFVDSAVTTGEAGALAANTATSSITTAHFGDYYSWGPNLSSTSETVTGDVIYAFGDKTLTFPDVQMPMLTQLQSPVGRIFPFIKFNKTDADCTSSCTISSFEYKWMKKTLTGWTPATLSEVSLIIANGGIGFRYDSEDNADKYINLSFSTEAISGSVEWLPANFSLEGVSSAEFQNLYTSQICHVGLFHSDKLGMKYFQNVYNAGGTCS